NLVAGLEPEQQVERRFVPQVRERDHDAVGPPPPDQLFQIIHHADDARIDQALTDQGEVVADETDDLISLPAAPHYFARDGDSLKVGPKDQDALGEPRWKMKHDYTSECFSSALIVDLIHHNAEKGLLVEQ